MGEPTRVAVTGASGYIALHVIAGLLDQGHEVRGTLRDMARGDQIRTALARQTEVSKLSFAQTDLTSDDGWDEAFAGCQYVQHIASPLPAADPKNHDELIIPARDGALRALGAATRAGVERVVMTSSVAAVGQGHEVRDNFTENDWSIETLEIGAYALSKTIAERAAWDFIAGLPDDQSLELVTINPSLVVGPLIDPDGSASIEIVRKFMAREVPGCPRFGISLVDVRDVAAAHIAAMTAPGAAGHRYICSTEFRWMSQIAEQLNTEFGPSGRPVPTRVLPNFAVRLVALFDPTVRRIVPDLEQQRDYDSSALRRDLNWQTRPMDESVRATAESLIELGVV
ncbi:MAG: NAD-dependent epimerase/dehydratase family protein [Alphaproteobacteria bacterium]|nr:NAD-dependent epimerase/dehydratase family protein [Alphaproteobacteria bacterium]MDP6831642.1 NAD-dependent epimerase/dehydratase family protein [Alphaproteobacteria bacterium]